MIDLKFNYPSVNDEITLITKFFEGDHEHLTHTLAFPGYQGLESCLNTAREWLNVQQGVSDLIICNSGNHALYCIITILKETVQDIITDPFTYPVLKQIALKNGIRLHAANTDEQGLTLEGIERMYESTHAKVLYLQPTIQNPTCTVMSPERRQQIAEFAKSKNLMLIEDDAYRFLHNDNTPPTFLEIIPSHTFHVYSLSKPFNPLIKTAFVALPVEWQSKMTDCVRITSSGSSSLLTAMADFMIKSKALDAIIKLKQNYAIKLQERIKPILSGLSYQTHPTGFHIWMSLPSHLKSHLLVNRLLQNGILIPGGADFAVNESVLGNNYIRIALAAEKDINKLEEALSSLRKLFY
jgi:DNA-binding transcriptional MocR family regulator